MRNEINKLNTQQQSEEKQITEENLFYLFFTLPVSVVVVFCFCFVFPNIN